MEMINYENVKQEYSLLKQEYATELNYQELTSLLVRTATLELKVINYFFDEENYTDGLMKIILEQISFLYENIRNKMYYMKLNKKL